MESGWTTKEPFVGQHLRRGERICRYAEQKLIPGVMPRVVLRMACDEEEPVRMAGMVQPYYPETTEEDVTCPGCLTAKPRSPAPDAGAASWNSRFRRTSRA